MSIGLNFGSEERPSLRSQSASPASANSFRVLLLGDFSGRGRRGEKSPLAGRKAKPIDRDNLEELMVQLGVRAENIFAGPDAQPVDVTFNEIDDFHPDTLYRNLDLFESLRSLRKKLNDPRTFPEAANTVRSWLAPDGETATTESAPEPAPAAPSAPPPPVDTENLLDQILEQEPESAPSRPSGSQWQDVIQEIVAPYVLPGTDPDQPALLECLDRIIAAGMTRLLHSPAFRELEATWRLLETIVKHVETGRHFKLSLFDVSRDELDDDLQNASSIKQSGLFQLLDPEQTGDADWDLIVSTETFSRTLEAGGLLSRLGTACLSAGSLLLAAADGTHVGCTNPDRRADPADWTASAEPEANELWTRLQASPLAGGIVLFWPQVLVRLPYGANTDPIESFQYEELTAPPTSADLLWGAPALLAVIPYARAATIPRNQIRPEDVQLIEGRPLLIYQDEDGSASHPCCELPLNQTALEKVLAAGLSPVVSVRDQDVVRFPTIRAMDGTSLSG